MVKIIKNPDEKFFAEISKAVADNDGYCPCAVLKNQSTKCMCEEFRNSVKEQKLGECHCGRYIAVYE